MNLWDGLAVVGACVSIAFCSWGVLVAYKTLTQFEEVEHKPLPEVYDIPNWQPMNPLAKQCNRTLKKMYKGKMRDELV